MPQYYRSYPKHQVWFDRWKLVGHYIKVLFLATSSCVEYINNGRVICKLGRARCVLQLEVFFFVLFQHQIPHTKAQVLSRRVWDILTLLPTSPILLQGFQQLESSENISLQQLLDPASPQKLMYSLYIVESLSRPSTSVKKNKSSVSFIKCFLGTYGDAQCYKQILVLNSESIFQTKLGKWTMNKKWTWLSKDRYQLAGLLILSPPPVSCVFNP